jgi:hypothetical protein
MLYIWAYKIKIFVEHEGNDFFVNDYPHDW